MKMVRFQEIVITEDLTEVLHLDLVTTKQLWERLMQEDYLAVVEMEDIECI